MEPKYFFYFYRRIETDREALGAANVTAVMNVPMNWNVSYREDGDTQDRPLYDGAVVPLDGKRKRFYASPPPVEY